jgi:hypothetical protein
LQTQIHTYTYNSSIYIQICTDICIYAYRYIICTYRHIQVYTYIYEPYIHIQTYEQYMHFNANAYVPVLCLYIHAQYMQI